MEFLTNPKYKNIYFH